MRLIDANKMREGLVWCKSQSSRYDDYWDDVIERLDAQPTVSGWISVKDRLPEAEQTVLAVKRLKNGRREYALARCIPDWETKDFTTGKVTVGPYWVCGGNNNVIMWTPLPEMPEDGDD